MTDPSTTTLYDVTTDVLYVKLCNAAIVTSREAPTDDGLILNEDCGGHVVGVQLLEASKAKWSNHPDRGLVPQPMAQALDTAIKRLGLPPSAKPKVLRRDPTKVSLCFGAIFLSIALISVLVGTYVSHKAGENFGTASLSLSIMGMFIYLGKLRR